jgi:Uma2 family endonuclease
MLTEFVVHGGGARRWVRGSLMATVISPTDRRVIIQGVSWETYERLLADFADTHAARVTFDQGTLEIMAPSFAPERPAHLLVQIVEILTEVRDMDLIGAGSPTFKREDMARGFEPAASFYLQYAADVRGNTEIDLDIDPPPDLVIEVDVTHPSLDKLPIYAALGVPEVWRYAERKVMIYRRHADVYTAMDASEVLSGVTSSQLTQLVQTGYDMPRPVWLRRLREWAESLH